MIIQCKIELYVYITRHVIPSRYYTSLLFGHMVMGFLGPMVFYLFSPLDSVLGPSSVERRVTKMGKKKLRKAVSALMWPNASDFSFLI